MAEPITLTTHRPVSWLRVYLEETRLLLVRYWWLLAGYSLILLIWYNWPLIDLLSRGLDRNASIVLNFGDVWRIFFYPKTLFMLATISAWPLLIWSDLGPDRRSSFWTVPVSRLTHDTARILPGAIVLLIIFLLVWYPGIIILSKYVEVPGLIAGFLPPLPFIALGVSLINLYLLSSLICLRVGQPWRWLFLYFPLSILILWGVQLLLDVSVIRLLFSPLMPPYGLLGGLGIALWDRMGDTVAPLTWVPFLWFGIISVSLYFTASRHQEV